MSYAPNPIFTPLTTNTVAESVELRRRAEEVLARCEAARAQALAAREESLKICREAQELLERMKSPRIRRRAGF